MSEQQLKQSPKLQICEALLSLNQAVERVLADLQRLENMPLFRRPLMKAMAVAIEETRAWANFEITETMHQYEEADWARFGRLRNRWEKRFRDPNDVLLEAERLKRKPRKPARKRRDHGSKRASHD